MALSLCAPASAFYLQKRNGIFYFRRALPRDAQKIINQREFITSLRTRLRDAAIFRSIVCLHVTNQLIQGIRMSGILDPLYQLKIRQALEWAERESATLNFANLFVPSSDGVASPATILPIISATEQYLTSSASRQAHRTGLIADLAAFFKEAQPQLTDIGTSDPEAAEAFLQREVIKFFGKVAKEALEMQQNPWYEAPIAPPTRNKLITPQNQQIVEHSPLLLDTWAEYAAEKGHAWKKTTLDGYFSTIREFSNDEFCGNRRIAEYTRDDLIKFRNIQLQLPSQRNKRKDYRGKSVTELLSMDIPDEDLLTGRTINEKLILLSQFFQWCKSIKGYTSLDIVQEIYVQDTSSARRAPFSDDDLTKLFANENPKHMRIDRPHKFWLPLIGLYTGARISEICQLHVNDVFQHEGIHIIRVTDDGEGQEVKTEAGKRMIPIHTDLIKAGFLRYVDQVRGLRHTRLFPDLTQGARKAGDQASKWFTRFRRARGIASPDIQGHEKVFHSFRHTAVTRLRHHQPPHDIGVIQQIIGHERELFGATNIYTHDFPIAHCKNVIDTLPTPLDIDALSRQWPPLMEHISRR